LLTAYKHDALVMVKVVHLRCTRLSVCHCSYFENVAVNKGFLQIRDLCNNNISAYRVEYKVSNHLHTPCCKQIRRQTLAVNHLCRFPDWFVSWTFNIGLTCQLWWIVISNFSFTRELYISFQFILNIN